MKIKFTKGRIALMVLLFFVVVSVAGYQVFKRTEAYKDGLKELLWTSIVTMQIDRVKLVLRLADNDIAKDMMSWAICTAERFQCMRVDSEDFQHMTKIQKDLANKTYDDILVTLNNYRDKTKPIEDCDFWSCHTSREQFRKQPHFK